TSEVAGVLPVPEDIRVKYGMAQFEPSLDSVQPHHHLASLQGTRKAILPVHNQEEKDLFRTMMSGNNSFGNFSSEAQVEASVRIWNARADTSDTIFYKLAEQLKVYYNSDWQRNSNIIQTKATTAQARQPLMKRIHDPNRLQMVPSVPQTTLKLHHVPAGMLSLGTSDETPRIDPPSISFTGLSSGASTSSTIATTQFIAGSSNAALPSFEAASRIDPSAQEPAPRTSSSGSPAAREARVPGPQPLSHGETLHQLAKRKVGDDLQQSEPPPKKPRKGRTCRKCGIESCPRKATWKYCCNKCQDCGKDGQDKSCLGRNPKFPTKTCREAVEGGKWDGWYFSCNR
ncbi:hypothetical protein B0H10DRAFT_1840261, partial [Mycena sp. CBHHK59/15]